MRNQSNASVQTQWFNVAKVSGGKMYDFGKKKCIMNSLYMQQIRSHN